MRINLPSKSKATVEHRCRHVIIPNKHRILSLHLNGYSLIDEFFIHCNIDSSFNRLESVILTEVFDYKLLPILFYLNSLPRLFSLSIELEYESYSISNIYRIIFRLPSLRFNNLSLPNSDEPNVLIPISINEKFSTIEHLVMKHSCNINEIISILHHTPHLRHLMCERLVETNEISGKEVQLALSNLTHVSFTLCLLDFDEFEVFIKKISSQLQVLRLETCTSSTYLDAHRWKNLIRKYMPRLCRFHWDHRIDVDDVLDTTPNHEAIKQFTSTFWMERQWFFEFKDAIDEQVYSIHPYR